MRRTKAMCSLIFIAGLSTHCVRQVPEDFLQCPCGPGWTCCELANICVREGNECTSDLVRDGGRGLKDADPLGCASALECSPRQVCYFGRAGCAERGVCTSIQPTDASLTDVPVAADVTTPRDALIVTDAVFVPDAVVADVGTDAGCVDCIYWCGCDQLTHEGWTTAPFQYLGRCR